MASMKSATVMPRSWVTGTANRPQLCRMPMLMVSITLDPARTAMVWALVKLTCFAVSGIGLYLSARRAGITAKYSVLADISGAEGRLP